MKEMFLRLGFSLTVAMKLVDDQGMAKLAYLTKNLPLFPGGLVSRKTSERGDQIFILVAKNLKLAAFMFK